MRKFVSISILAAVIIFWFVFAIHNALAGTADFDPTFGSTGKITTPMTAGGAAEINKVVVQPDGKILVVGYAQDNPVSHRRIALARYLPDGSLDTTFGFGGKEFTTIPGGDSYAYDAVVQPNGRIVVVGMFDSDTSRSSVIVRYNSNATLDTSFSGDGIHTYNFNQGTADHATSVVLQPDGKVLVASTLLLSLEGNLTFGFYVSRFTSTGNFDTTFNNSGKVSGDFGSLTTGYVKIGLQPDGKIVATGPGGNGATTDFAAIRFTASGAFDVTFGSAGRVYTNFNGNDVPRTMTMLPDGRFVVGGSNGEIASSALMLVRYMPNGSMDPTFGFGGYVAQQVSDGIDVVEAIAVQPDGKTVAVGRASGSQVLNEELLVVRYTATGLADQGFGTNGVKKIAFGLGSDLGRSVAVQANGRILAAGSSEVNSPLPSFAIARLLGRPTIGDYDNDGVSDLSVFRPSDGTWYLNRSDDGYIEYPFGIATDRSLVGDFDGDGRSDIAVFRPTNGRWYVLRSTAGYMTVNFGMQGDIPVTGDFDGDDKTDVAVFRPSTGIWYCLKSSSGFSSSFAQQFGLTGDKPVQGDYDRDGKADLAVYRPSDSVWYILGSTRGFYAARFGLSTDVPAPADFDGDSAQDIAVYRPSDGVWHLLRSSDGAYQPVRFGLSGDIPQPGDFDLDGRSDIAVFRPSDGVWHILRSSDGGYRASAWGLNGDRPAVVTSVD